MKRIIDDNEGAIGFFVDVPALLIVVVATLIFLGGVYSALQGYKRNGKISEFEENAIQFALTVRSCPLLLYKDQVGQFDATKVIGLNSENLTRELHPRNETYYRIILTDESGYDIKYNKTWIRKPPHGFDNYSFDLGKRVIQFSVDIVVSEDEVHAATLMVKVWR